MEIFKSSCLLFVFTIMCVVASDAQNSKLLEKIEKLELSTFSKNPCQNCMVEQRVKYLEIVLKKILAINLMGQSVNWSNNFAFCLASAITYFGFNLAVTVLRIYYTNRINKKFKIWEERMQFPPAANYEMTILGISLFCSPLYIFLKKYRNIQNDMTSVSSDHFVLYLKT